MVLAAYEVRSAREEDTAAISDVVLRALYDTNAMDYPPEVIARVAPTSA